MFRHIEKTRRSRAWIPQPNPESDHKTIELGTVRTFHALQPPPVRLKI